MSSFPDVPPELLAAEDEWIYVSGALQVDDLQAAADLYETVAAACESSGWYTVCPHRELLDANRRLITDEAAMSALYSWARAAVAEAQACVMYVGQPSSGVGLELAMAAESGRPIIALHLAHETPSPLVVSLLSGHVLALQCTA